MNGRAVALRPHLLGLVGLSWSTGPITIQIDDAQIDELGRLIVFCRAWRARRPIPLDLPLIFVNPPLLIRANGGSVLDPLAAARTIIGDTVALFG